jgi:CheY-like chemotaxis protein
VGIRTEVADNGKIGVEIVRSRKDRGEEPFDLIFMDMFMPVMDGMEAASEITALDTGSPIVAMTANVMASELEKYKKNGMPDCLGKPFTSQELWHILLKYLTPIGSSHMDEQGSNEELQRKLRLNFAKNNRSVLTEITGAVTAGDAKLAHRLAHTLKGNAGLIGMFDLQKAAAEVEYLLKDGVESIWENKLKRLETELTLALDEMEPLSDVPSVKQKSEPLSEKQTLKLFEELEFMLENINPECIRLVDDIRAVPGAELLAEQVENFEFESAAVTLEGLKKEWLER